MVLIIISVLIIIVLKYHHCPYGQYQSLSYSYYAQIPKFSVIITFALIVDFYEKKKLYSIITVLSHDLIKFNKIINSSNNQYTWGYDE